MDKSIINHIINILAHVHLRNAEDTVWDSLQYSVRYYVEENLQDKIDDQPAFQTQLEFLQKN